MGLVDLRACTRRSSDSSFGMGATVSGEISMLTTSHVMVVLENRDILGGRSDAYICLDCAWWLYKTWAKQGV
jgi:hypothetical protein